MILHFAREDRGLQESKAREERSSEIHGKDLEVPGQTTEAVEKGSGSNDDYIYLQKPALHLHRVKKISSYLNQDTVPTAWETLTPS